MAEEEEEESVCQSNAAAVSIERCILSGMHARKFETFVEADLKQKLFKFVVESQSTRRIFLKECNAMFKLSDNRSS